LVNDCVLPRRYDFKRMFEDGATTQSQFSAAFGLTQAAAMLIKRVE
jgi:hypothetical protein